MTNIDVVILPHFCNTTLWIVRLLRLTVWANTVSELTLTIGQCDIFYGPVISFIFYRFASYWINDLG